MTRKYFPFCFYVLVSVLCLGRPSLAYPAGSFGGGGATPAVTNASETDSITPLKIGDKIPDELWDYAFPVVSPHADQVQYLSLGDFRDKLIILDFWATWCAPCISSLYKLDTLQQEFADDLLVFPTSYESEDKVHKFFVDKRWSLPTAFEETHLKKYFSHRSIPHQVWIKGGEVMAITGPEYASRENILSITKGDQVRMHMKDQLDREVDNVDDAFDDGLLYRSSIKIHDPMKQTGRVQSKNGVVATNMTMTQLFREAFSDFLPIQGYLNRMVFEMPIDKQEEILGTGRTLKGEYKNDSLYHDWLRNNTYCYSIWFEKEVEPDIRKSYMAMELTNFFKVHLGINSKVEYREKDCLVLEEIGVGIAQATPGIPRQIDGRKSFASIDRFINSMQYVNYDIPTPIINGLEDHGNFEILISADLTDVSKVNEELRVYGLQLTLKTQRIPLLVFEETPKHNATL